MNFIKDKVKKFHEKKLKDAQGKLSFHKDIKTKLIKELSNTNEYKLRIVLKEKISEQNKFMEIWSRNVDTINNQLKKINE